MVLPAEWKDAERWLQRRLRRGEIPGYKVGPVWRMTKADVEALIARYRNNTNVSADPAPRPLPSTRTSRRSMRQRAD